MEWFFLLGETRRLYSSVNESGMFNVFLRIVAYILCGRFGTSSNTLTEFNSSLLVSLYIPRHT